MPKSLAARGPAEHHTGQENDDQGMRGAPAGQHVGHVRHQQEEDGHEGPADLGDGGRDGNCAEAREEDHVQGVGGAPKGRAHPERRGRHRNPARPERDAGPGQARRSVPPEARLLHVSRRPRAVVRPSAWTERGPSLGGASRSGLPFDSCRGLGGRATRRSGTGRGSSGASGAGGAAGLRGGTGLVGVVRPRRTSGSDRTAGTDLGSGLGAGANRTAGSGRMSGGCPPFPAGPAAGMAGPASPARSSRGRARDALRRASSHSSAATSATPSAVPTSRARITTWRSLGPVPSPPRAVLRRSSTYAE